MLGMLYGRSPPPWLPGRRLKRGWFLAITMLPVFAGVAALLLVTVVVDPYDLRPWGLRPRVALHGYPMLEGPLLIKATGVSARPQVVMVGASSLFKVTREQMDTAFGADAHAVSFAFAYAGPLDTSETLEIVARMPSVRRVIFVMDHTQMLPLEEKREPWVTRGRVFSSNWAHAGDFRLPTIKASWRRLYSGVFDLPDWGKDGRHQRRDAGKAVAQQPATLKRLQRLLVAHAGQVFEGPVDDDCRRFPAVKATLLPSIAMLARRGITVDLLFPPYPYIAYYDWRLDRRDRGKDYIPAGPVYRDRMVFKACVLSIAERVGGRVRVVAVDNDAAITGDLANYSDMVHLLNPVALQRTMDHVARGDAILTRANFAEYRRRLDAAIVAVPHHPPAPLTPVR